MRLINIGHMFHDDTLQTKTFILCSESEVYYTEIDNEFVQQVLSQIETAISLNKSHVDVRQLGLVYKGRYWDDPILEISWD
jgi:hypothetical protein